MTRPLLELLDDGELEAVLAHELAHIAHRDSAVMDICSTPSRILLAFAATVAYGFAASVRSVDVLLHAGWIVGGLGLLTVFFAPPAFLIGWVSRLSVLGISRAREFSADAAAVTLTGRPSALTSALIKLERQRGWAPGFDLRQAAAYDVLCIVGPGSRLGRLFASHPPVAARVARLEEIEKRIAGRAQALDHAASGPGRIGRGTRGQRRQRRRSRG